MMEEDKLATYKSKLRDDFPTLSISSLKIIGKGWHHDAVEVNGNTVFRLPRGDHGSDITSTSVKYETAVLKLLKGKLTVEIPDPIYIANDFGYFGYPKIQGVLLAELWDDLGQSKKDSILHTWVDTIVTVHESISLPEALQLEIPLFVQPNSDMTEVAKRILDTPGLNGDVYAFSKRVFTALEKVDIQKEQNTVIHNDLHLFNMLVNPDSHEFTGAIDWTDICIGPVARDFAVWEWRHDGSLEKAAQIYKDKTGKSLDIMQARLWKYVENISDIVEATESHDTAKVKECLERINLWSSTYDTLNKV